MYINFSIYDHVIESGIFKESGVKHTYDMWHGAKNLGKKIHAVSRSVIFVRKLS